MITETSPGHKAINIVLSGSSSTDHDLFAESPYLSELIDQKVDGELDLL